MNRIALLVLLSSASASSLAQYDGPALETCLRYARHELAVNHDKARDVAFDRDRNLTIERYTRKVGSQFVSSVLMGNGALLLGGGAREEQSFVCLLADDKRAVFFYWLPRAR